MILATETSIRRQLASKKAPIARPIYLANSIETIEFIPMGNAVELVHRNEGAKFGVRTRMTLEGARAKYRRLTAAGYSRW